MTMDKMMGKMDEMELDAVVGGVMKRNLERFGGVCHYIEFK